MPTTYEPIASTTLSAGTATIDFTSIPQTYTDLVFVVSGKNTVAATNIQLRFNSDTGSNYSNTSLTGNGSSASSGRSSNVTYSFIGDLGAGSEYSTIVTHIFNYSNTTTFKTLISRSNLASIQVILRALLWRSTSAITSIQVSCQSDSLASGSTFTLYGIKAA
jgi:hypothetical protein